MVLDDKIHFYKLKVNHLMKTRYCFSVVVRKRRLQVGVISELIIALAEKALNALLIIVIGIIQRLSLCWCLSVSLLSASSPGTAPCISSCFGKD